MYLAIHSEHRLLACKTSRPHQRNEGVAYLLAIKYRNDILYFTFQGGLTGKAVPENLYQCSGTVELSCVVSGSVGSRNSYGRPACNCSSGVINQISNGTFQTLETRLVSVVG